MIGVTSVGSTIVLWELLVLTGLGKRLLGHPVRFLFRDDGETAHSLTVLHGVVIYITLSKVELNLVLFGGS